ncbi:hypothetical protein BCR35DRAFT_324579 [Leucosporidium creatinivorum]|uniref:SWIM-type domain-containing protein n=1 Tax=Leucosporidium creatinivorum TaxID=106004 RepID=A0A1Y2FRX1_9BASI|nr:hypothetical protein BCR35DRAFT_324579 [Leucosporidium creatinivorum]
MTRSPLPLARLLLYSLTKRPTPRPPSLHLFTSLNRARPLSSTAPLLVRAKAAVPESQEAQEIVYIHPHLDLMDIPPSLVPNWPVGEQMFVQGSTGSSYALTRHTLNNYSCSCPAWKFHKGQTSQVRTCKHLRDMLGDDSFMSSCDELQHLLTSFRVETRDCRRLRLSEPRRRGRLGESGLVSTPPRVSTTEMEVYQMACVRLHQAAQHENARTGTTPSKKKATKKRPAASATPGEGGEDAEAAPPVKKKAAPRKKKVAEDEGAAAGGGGVQSGFTPLLLAQSFELGGKKDPEGMWVSEKLDGVRAYWDGIDTVWSRRGKPFSPPKFFLDQLPRDVSLDGELYLGRDRFDETSGIVRTTNSNDASDYKWKEMKFMVFDIPSSGNQPFEARLQQLNTLFPADKPGPVQVVKHELCKGIEDLNEKLTAVQKVDGEGLMLRVPKSEYVGKRDKSLLKVKTFYDAEAKVVGYEPGKGKYEQVVGSLICEMESGQQFSVGSGLSDARRADPPQLGAIISYRFQELTKANIPRFPTFVGERADMDAPKDCIVRSAGGRANLGAGDD